MPVKEEFDRAVPPHELLDVSANKSKAELATRGGLANRQLPTGKRSGGLSNSSSVCISIFTTTHTLYFVHTLVVITRVMESSYATTCPNNI